MFRKPFTVKSNTNMRNSERRKLIGRLNIPESVPPKQQAAHVIMTTSDSIKLDVYLFDKNPLLFEVEGDQSLYPTVYFTWISPLCYPTLFVAEEVISFLEGGADLMLPGVIRRPGMFPKFDRFSPVAVSSVNKDGQVKGPLAIGVSLMSSMEMIANGMQGRGVRILHMYRDYLWEFGNRQHPPLSSAGEFVIKKTLTEDDFPPLGATSVVEGPPQETPATNTEVAENSHENIPKPSEETHTSTADGVEAENVEKEVESMEELLRRCFLAGLKFRVTKQGVLPLDVGEFYSRYLLACVPPNRRIDMKKTVYKKFSTFLTSINSDVDGPVIKLSSKSKGADFITEIDWSHPMLVNFRRTDEITENVQQVQKQCLKVEEYFALTEPVAPLFRSVMSISKGDLITANEARQSITSFIKNRDLNEGKKISLRDDLLRSIVKHSEETIDWNTLMQRILAKMTRTFIVTTSDGRQFTRKLELPKIIFKVETRSGNKKVTLISNLAVFGIEAKPFCQEVKTGVAASATWANEAAQCEGPQVVIQGNQVQFASELLTSEYGVDKKYMEGLELIPKKKK